VTTQSISLLGWLCALFALVPVHGAFGQHKYQSLNRQTNLDQKVRSAELIVVGQFLNSPNERRAKAPIKVSDTLKGKVRTDTGIVACFQATGLTVSPKKLSKWIFLLLASTETKNGKEFRKIVGENYDYVGIFPATDENIEAIKRLVERDRPKKE